MTKTNISEIAVIGGGLVGASIAWGLARSGLNPLVLDGEDLDPRASRANFALVWVQGKGMGAPHYALWSKASAERWPDFAAALHADTGIDVSLRQRGAFSFALSQGELDTLHAEMKVIDRETDGKAVPYEVLGPGETRDRLPGLGPDVAGSIYSPADGDVNALRLLRALHAALKSKGVDYRARHAVERIEPLADGFRLCGRWGDLFARRIVLAAGLGNAHLAPMVGLAAPLKRSKGQVLVTERCAPFFPYTSATIRQTDEGGVMIGDSEETNTSSTATNQEISAVLAGRAIRVFPALADLNIVRSWTGFRVKSADGLPIYEQSAAHPGAFIALCHSGVTLAANHALVVAPQIAAGALSPDLAPFHSRRFHVPQAA
ncbi:MAG: FAD-dependent oxidoreductase [Shinella sp.]|nr:FAD-dependent oxidoreductase [Shinella sp.]